MEVAELSKRSKKHGRGCHMAMDVTQEDFDSMVALVDRYGGKNQGDNRAGEVLRPEGNAASISSTQTITGYKSPPMRQTNG